MAIRSAQTTLNQLYAARDDFFAGKTVASYSIGDRNITVSSLSELEEQIRNYEQIVMASTAVVSNQGGPARGARGFEGAE